MLTIMLNQVVSMNIVYGIRYAAVRSDLRKETIAKRKQRRKNMIHDYYEVVIIIDTRSNHSEVLTNSKNLDPEVTLNSNEELIIKNAAKWLRNDILDFRTRLLSLSWPPTLKELLSDDRLPPPLTTLFLITLLKSSKKAATDRIRRLVEPFSADFVYGVNGELTSKHYLLAHGLHCITGNKETVQITKRFDHCRPYDIVLDIEIKQEQKAVTLINNADTFVLPLQPKSYEETVLTVFWADNFDKNKGIDIVAVTDFRSSSKTT